MIHLLLLLICTINPSAERCYEAVYGTAPASGVARLYDPLGMELLSFAHLGALAPLIVTGGEVCFY